MQPTPHLPADQRRAVTVEAVIELAAGQNPGDITTAAIAQKMHLTQGALFRHFASKEAIWLAVAEWVATTLLERVGQAAEAVESPAMALEAVFLAHIDFVASHPGVPRMMFSELQRAEETPAKRVMQTLFARYRERLAALLEAGKCRGELDPELDPVAAATLFVGMIQGLVVQALLTGDPERMRTGAPKAFAIYRRGIGGGR
jgi:AcrR family transcriptional regulator